MSLELFLQDIGKMTLTLDGWCVPEKAISLASAVVKTEADISVELGVYGGRGAMAMAMAHRNINHGITWGFDPWTNAAAVEGTNDKENEEWWAKLDLEAIFRVFVEKVHAHSLFKFLYYARLKSEKAVLLFDDESVSVIHVDTNHSEEVSCAEIVAWGPKIKMGGYWYADDTDWPTMQKANALMLTKGFKLLEDHAKWRIYQKVKKS